VIGLDTNVLCRYLLADDPQQTAKAEETIEDALERGEACFVSKIVLCELVWVLETCTPMDTEEISGTLDKLLHVANLKVEEREQVRRALALFKTERGDFSGHLIHQTNVSAGSRKTVTFDKDLRGLPGFEVL
jgi:predicted nucleic-acid-binding protein